MRDLSSDGKKSPVSEAITGPAAANTGFTNEYQWGTSGVIRA